MDKQSKIYVAGHHGMVGSAIVRQLRKEGYENFVLRSSKELDLRDQAAVNCFFEDEKPEYVFLAAAKVGGIVANNTYRAQFIYENMMIECNIIHASYRAGVKKLLFLGSSCIYPKFAPQPIKEEHLLTGILEETNEPYAIAKIAGIKMCEAYFAQYGCNFTSVMPTNLYGPNDNYDLKNSHVLPALIRKMLLGKWLKEGNWDMIRKDLSQRPIGQATSDSSSEVIFDELKQLGLTDRSILLWGDGSPLREFLYVEDMADACIYVMKNIDADGTIPSHINVGCGSDLSIKSLSEIVQSVIDYDGEIIWDTSKPNGTPRKLMDSSKLFASGWSPKVSLHQGISMVVENYLANFED